MDSVSLDLLVPFVDAAVVAWGASCLLIHIARRIPRADRTNPARIDELSERSLSPREPKPHRAPDELGLLPGRPDSAAGRGRRLI